MSRDSEFACEVVRVTEVLPHPNADRLEIVHFETKEGPSAYTVVDGKGNRRPGDLATYVGVDCIVPLTCAEFGFLAARPESKGKATHRIRAARLRGVYSEGLLVNAPRDAELGVEMGAHLGITYHVVPERAVSLTGPTPPSPKKDWRKNVIPEFGVASLRKVPFHFQAADSVVITEKVHGTNFRFGWVKRPGLFGGWHWTVGSHRVFKTDNRPWYERLFRRWTPPLHWYGEDLWTTTAETRGLKALAKRYRGIVFYGEIYGLTSSGKPIQDLTYGAIGTRLVILDAYDTERGEFLPWIEMTLAASDLNLSTPPILHYGPYPGLDKVRELAEGESRLCPEQIREGVVVRSRDGAKRGKWVGEGYRLRKQEPEHAKEAA